MTDNDEKNETRKEEQLDLEHQQHELFDELDKEKQEAEQALDEKQADK